MLKDFKAFVLRGNVMDLAVGVILGTAFGAIVKSLVNDVIMPPIGLLLGGVDFSNLFLLLKAGSPTPPYASLADAQAAGAVTVNYGVFVNAIISFLIVAFVIFLLIRSLNRMTQKEEAAPAEPTTKECPYCLSTIPIKATRCAHCTSDLSVT
ncbi:MAG: large conductance mechanosensitive channel protein MscL [Anaerolineae bacterium]|nr:large conductance mechanosensitive channel protein MscL [Anaerolineae bacterium]